MAKRLTAEQKIRRKWKTAIRKRDGRICHLCKRTYRLNIHHILPYGLFEDFRWSTWNGIVLCKKCHGRVHGLIRLSKRRNLQFLDFFGALILAKAIAADFLQKRASPCQYTNDTL